VESLNILVTGGTGVLGRPVVQHLRDAGHRVRVLAHSPQSEARVRSLGADPVPGSLFDPASLASAARGAQAVLHLATRIPPLKDMRRPEAWAETERIRSEGTRKLVDAAIAAGVATFVYPGVCFAYPDRGAAWIDASTEEFEPSPVVRSLLDAESEVSRFTRAGGRGVVLRMGYFYHTDAPNTRESMALARRGVATIIGASKAYLPQIWVDDAASAVVAALDRAPAGTYDVVDDEPLTRGELVRLLARAVGRRWLVQPPVWLVRLSVGRDRLLVARSQRVTNRRFKAATGWAPSVPSARDGWSRIASSASSPHTHAVDAGGIPSRTS
jgi:2-alkyl-3-oxoalkanoate reductase